MGGMAGPAPRSIPPRSCPNLVTLVSPASSCSLMSRFSIRESTRTGCSRAHDTCVAADNDKMAPGTSLFATSTRSFGSNGTKSASGLGLLGLGLGFRAFANCARVYERGGRASPASLLCHSSASPAMTDISGRYPSGPAATSASRMMGDAILPLSTRSPIARVAGAIARGSRKTKRSPLLLPNRAKVVRSLSRLMANRSGLA
mmetsp:Transcript_44/g.213  ORF Transcript_44/g.213 Transcript_44/m.213 type:complete len:202 (+) Transcript_44:870-1475(+)